MTEATQGPDKDPLEETAALIEEIESHQERLRAMVAGGEMTAEVLASEVAETFMSLLGDLARNSTDVMIEVREYLDREVGPALTEMDERFAELEERDSGDDSQLVPEDSQLFMQLFQWMRGAIEDTETRAREGGDETAMQALAVLRADVEKAIARVAEITMEDEPDEPAPVRQRVNGAPEAG